MSSASLSNLTITDTLRLDNYVVRPSRAADIPGIVSLLNAHSRDVLGTSTILIEHYSALWPKHYFNAAENTVVVTTFHNEIVGYMEMECDHPGVILEIAGAVHPNHRNQGIGRLLLRWAERRAGIRSLQAPAGTQVSLQIVLHEEDQDAHGLISHFGFVPTRRWDHFEIGLLNRPKTPIWPEGVTVRPLDPRRDWPMVGAAMLEAYEDHWGHISESFPAPPPAPEDELAEAATFFEDDPYFNTHGLCFVAEKDGQTVGSCICASKTIEWQDTGQIGSVSVRQPWRRQGVATALVQHAFQEFYRRGIYRVIAVTDRANFTGATDLFTSLGMIQFRYTDMFEKVIRPGRELRRLRNN